MVLILMLCFKLTAHIETLSFRSEQAETPKKKIPSPSPGPGFCGQITQNFLTL